MDNNYIITPNGSFISEDELYHHGTRGMKWGIRRYQNKDGSLTAAGRKRYGVDEGDGRNARGGDRSTSKETNPRKSRGTGTDSSGRSERANEKEATKAKKTVSEEKAKKQEEEAKEKKVEEKKDDNATNERRTKLDGKSLDEISDKNLNDRLNRMRNEDAYDKMMVERGYVQVEKYSDMDRKISELKKQKEYADLLVGMDTQTQISELSRQKELKQLQKDVKDLDAQLNPKKTSAVKKLMNTVVDKVVVPAAINSGEKVLESYLTEKGLSLIKKETDKEAEKLAAKEKKVQDAFAKEKAKADAKAAEKNAKRSAEEYAKTETKNESANYRSKVGERSQIDPNETRALAIYDKPVSSFFSTAKSKGQSYTNKKYSNLDDDGDYVTVTDNTPKSSIGTTKSSTISLGQRSVAGYLSAPASSASSSTIALGERKVAGYLSAPTSSISGYLPAPSSSSSGYTKKKRFSTSITKNATGTSARINNMKATGNYTNAEIAKKLGVSESTVDRYLYGGDD